MPINPLKQLLISFCIARDQFRSPAMYQISFLIDTFYDLYMKITCLKDISWVPDEVSDAKKRRFALGP